MGISFNQIPDVLLVPGMYQEIDNSLAGTKNIVKKVLLIGLVCSSAIVKASIPVRVASKIKACEAFGYGSPLAIMCESFFDSKTSGIELYALPIAESGTLYEESFTIAKGSSAVDGSVTICINDKTASIAYSKTDTDENIASAIVASINSIFNCPISASSEKLEDAGVILKIKANAKGFANIKLSFNTDGVSITSKTKTEAKYAPVVDWTQCFEALGNERYNYIISGLEDAETLNAWSKELEDRYSAMRQISGRMFAYLSGNIGDVSDEASIIGKASKVNSPHIVLLPYNNIAALPESFITKTAATAINVLSVDPAANTYGLEVKDLRSVASGETLKAISTDEREKLLQAGVATWDIGAEGSFLIERLVTSYNKNQDGERDTSYLDIQVVETVDAIRSYINSEAKRRFKGWKLSSTEENFGAGSKVMTPAIFKSFLVEIYKNVFMNEKQWTEDFEGYKQSISAEVKTGSKTRLEYMHSPVLIGQFYQAMGLNQFR